MSLKNNLIASSVALLSPMALNGLSFVEHTQPEGLELIGCMESNTLPRQHTKKSWTYPSEEAVEQEKLIRARSKEGLMSNSNTTGSLRRDTKPQGVSTKQLEYALRTRSLGRKHRQVMKRWIADAYSQNKITPIQTFEGSRSGTPKLVRYSSVQDLPGIEPTKDDEEVISEPQDVNAAKAEEFLKLEEQALKENEDNILEQEFLRLEAELEKENEHNNLEEEKKLEGTSKPCQVAVVSVLKTAEDQREELKKWLENGKREKREKREREERKKVFKEVTLVELHQRVSEKKEVKERKKVFKEVTLVELHQRVSEKREVKERKKEMLVELQQRVSEKKEAEGQLKVFKHMPKVWSQLRQRVSEKQLLEGKRNQVTKKSLDTLSRMYQDIAKIDRLRSTRRIKTITFPQIRKVSSN